MAHMSPSLGEFLDINRKIGRSGGIPPSSPSAALTPSLYIPKRSSFFPSKRAVGRSRPLNAGPVYSGAQGESLPEEPAEEQDSAHLLAGDPQSGGSFKGVSRALPGGLGLRKGSF